MLHRHHSRLNHIDYHHHFYPHHVLNASKIDGNLVVALTIINLEAATPITKELKVINLDFNLCQIDHAALYRIFNISGIPMACLVCETMVNLVLFEVELQTNPR